MGFAGVVSLDVGVVPPALDGVLAEPEEDFVAEEPVERGARGDGRRSGQRGERVARVAPMLLGGAAGGLSDRPVGVRRGLADGHPRGLRGGRGGGDRGARRRGAPAEHGVGHRGHERDPKHEQDGQQAPAQQVVLQRGEEVAYLAHRPAPITAGVVAELEAPELEAVWVTPAGDVAVAPPVSPPWLAGST